MTNEKGGGLTLRKDERTLTSNSGGGAPIYSTYKERIISIASKDPNYTVSNPFQIQTAGAWVMVQNVSTMKPAPNVTLDVIVYYYD